MLTTLARHVSSEGVCCSCVYVCLTLSQLCLLALQLYGVPKDVAATDKRLLERRLDLTHSAAVVLDKNNLIKYDRRSGNFQVRHAVRAASLCTFMCDILLFDSL